MSLDVVNLFIGVPLKILNVYHICPLQQNLTSKEKMPYYICLILFHLFEYGFALFEIIYIVSIFGDINEVADSSNLLFSQIAMCIKFSLIAWRRKELISMLQLMKQKLFMPRTETHIKRLKTQGRIFTRICLFFLISANLNASIWTLIPLFSTERRFPFKIWMPINREDTMQYTLGYVFQALAIYTSAMFYAAVDQLPLGMLMFICAQLEIIGDKLKEIKSEIDFKPEAKNEYLGKNNEILEDCIKHHQALLRFLKLVEDAYHTGICIQLISSVATYCMIGLRITQVNKTCLQFFSMVTYMNTMLAQILFYCWCGQKLTRKAEELRIRFYGCPWYKQNTRFRRTLWIALERLARPLVFRPGKYFALSHPLFVQILRCSYSYFVVLYRTSQDS